MPEHEITVTADVLFAVTCSCGERLMDAREAPLELINRVAADHLDKMYPVLEWKELANGKYIHGVCDTPGCIWCDRFYEREACD